MYIGAGGTSKDAIEDEEETKVYLVVPYGWQSTNRGLFRDAVWANHTVANLYVCTKQRFGSQYQPGFGGERIWRTEIACKVNNNISHPFNNNIASFGTLSTMCTVIGITTPYYSSARYGPLGKGRWVTHYRGSWCPWSVISSGKVPRTLWPG